MNDASRRSSSAGLILSLIASADALSRADLVAQTGFSRTTVAQHLGALLEAGLYCRADDRGDPVIQLSPPLISDASTFHEIEQIVRGVLTEAWTKL